MGNRTCRKCNNTYPLTKDYFGHTPSGGFRGVCRKCIAKNVAEHTKKNPEKTQERYKLRQERLNSQEKITITKEQVEEIRAKLLDCCDYCGESLKGEGDLEHIIPISRGGVNNISNITLACYTCNKEKHNKTREEFLDWRRKLGLKIRV